MRGPAPPVTGRLRRAEGLRLRTNEDAETAAARGRKEGREDARRTIETIRAEVRVVISGVEVVLLCPWLHALS